MATGLETKGFWQAEGWQLEVYAPGVTTTTYLTWMSIWDLVGQWFYKYHTHDRAAVGGHIHIFNEKASVKGTLQPNDAPFKVLCHNINIK